MYVFALLAHTDKATVNPLDLDQWTFYVLPTAILDDRTRSQQSITLKTLKGLATGIGFGELREAVKLAAEHTASVVPVQHHPGGRGEHVMRAADS